MPKEKHRVKGTLLKTNVYTLLLFTRPWKNKDENSRPPWEQGSLAPIYLILTDFPGSFHLSPYLPFCSHSLKCSACSFLYSRSYSCFTFFPLCSSSFSCSSFSPLCSRSFSYSPFSPLCYRRGVYFPEYPFFFEKWEKNWKWNTGTHNKLNPKLGFSPHLISWSPPPPQPPNFFIKCWTIIGTSCK